LITVQIDVLRISVKSCQTEKPFFWICQIHWKNGI